jgi:hypothetical protein
LRNGYTPIQREPEVPNEGATAAALQQKINGLFARGFFDFFELNLVVCEEAGFQFGTG